MLNIFVLFKNHPPSTELPETNLKEHWGNVKETANITKKVFLSDCISVFCFLNFRGGFLLFYFGRNLYFCRIISKGNGET